MRANKNRQTIEEKTRTTNLAGGTAYQQGPERELAHLLVVSTMCDKMYRSGTEEIRRINALYAKLDPYFCAQAAIFTREVMNMRSTSHVLASQIFNDPGIRGKQWATRFFKKIIVRPDDMGEVIAFAWGGTDRPAHSSGKKAGLPSAVRKGFGQALSGMSSYQLAKYKASRKGLSLKKIIRLVHPSHTEAIGQLMDGTLAAPENLGTKLGKAGQSSDTENREAAKTEAWREMLESKYGMPFMALLRNLRNILQTEDYPLIALACKQLVIKEKILKSRVFPFRIYTAYREISAIDQNVNVRKVLTALDDAFDMAIANVPVLEGTSAVWIDSSGSMTMSAFSKHSTVSCVETAAVFGCVLAKANNANLFGFNGEKHVFPFNPKEASLDMISKVVTWCRGGTTDFRIPFGTSDVYDRIIICSDMQGWVEQPWGHGRPVDAYKKYKKRTDTDPWIYFVDVRGGGTTQLPDGPESKILQIAGFAADKMFEMMKSLEKNPDEMIDQIKAIEI